MTVQRRRARRGQLGGARPGSGRKRGGESEYRRVARAQARRSGTGLLPDELLRQWADTGQMEYPGRKEKDGKVVELSASDRIACAKGAAQFYKHPMRPAQDEAPRPVVVTVDDKMIAALVAAGQVDKLEVFREVLLAIQSGGANPGQLAPRQTDASASRYARTLGPDTETAGRA